MIKIVFVLVGEKFCFWTSLTSIELLATSSTNIISQVLSGIMLLEGALINKVYIIGI